MGLCSILPPPEGEGIIQWVYAQFSLSLEGEGWGEGEIAGISNFAYTGETPPP